jgi:hypothetical protein
MIVLPEELEIRTLVDDLFVLTDQKAWSQLRRLFADGLITVDMSSLAGGGPVEITADQLIAGFESGLHREKQSHHLATNYRVTVSNDRAEVTAQGYAWNRVITLAPPDDFWETWGSYRISCRRVGQRWQVDGFSYFSKHTRGPDSVRTHSL